MKYAFVFFAPGRRLRFVRATGPCWKGELMLPLLRRSLCLVWEVENPDHVAETPSCRVLPDGSSGCLDCGVPYASPRFPDLVIPDEAWRAISPNGDEGGLMCPGCISARLEAAGLSGVPGKFTSGPMAARG